MVWHNLQSILLLLEPAPVLWGQDKLLHRIAMNPLKRVLAQILAVSGSSTFFILFLMPYNAQSRVYLRWTIMYLFAEPTLGNISAVTSTSMIVSWATLNGGAGDNQTYYVTARSKANPSQTAKGCSSAGTSCSLDSLSAFSPYSITVKSCATSNASFCGQPSDEKEQFTLPGSTFRIIEIWTVMLAYSRVLCCSMPLQSAIRLCALHY